MKSHRGRAVLAVLAAFASVEATAAPFSATWTQHTATQTPAGAPGGRAWVDTIYDPVAQQTVLFAGSGGFYYNDVLDLDIVQNKWTQKEPFILPKAIFPPCGRDEYAFEYDAFNDLYWSFGGSGYACSQFISTAQAGTTSTVLVDPTLTATTNDFYKDWIVSVVTTIQYTVYVAGYNAATKQLTLATPVPTLAPGIKYTLQPQKGGGTWSYDPATRAWRGFDAPSYGYTGAKPLTRLSPALAYSSADNALVMFGGGTHNDTWALDAETQTWVQMRRDGDSLSPPPRAEVTTSMVYDSVNDVFILYGGRCGDNTGRCTYNQTLGDTWAYKLSTNTWTKMNPAQSPGLRQQHMMAFDPVHHVVVLFGGHNAFTTYFNDVWLYDYAANTWTQVPTPAFAPTPRYIASLSYNPVIGEFVLFGGCISTSATSAGLFTLKITDIGSDNPPTAVIAVNPTSGTTSTVFAFSGSQSSDPDGSIVSYAWDFGDGTTGSGVSVNKQYSAQGTYTAHLTVSDNQGATGSASVQVSVGSAPSITFSSTTLSGSVANGTVTQVTLNGAPVSFTTGANGAWSVSLPITASGQLSIAVTASGAGGTTTKTVTVNIP